MLRSLVLIFASRRGPWLAAALGMLFCMPALWAGLMGDDYLWWLMLQGKEPWGAGLPPLLHVYNFITGGLDREVLQGVGLLTWWSDPELRIALFRPLTVATYMFDHLLAPRNFVLQHAHSLLWYGATVVVVGSMYRRLHAAGSGAVSGLAVLLFALEDAHAMNAGWICSRHVLMSLVFGGLGFLAHVLWRRKNKSKYLACALLATTASLLCGESALGILAYVVAYQLTLDDRRWSSRLLALLPYTLLVVLWRVVYNALGYGIQGSSLYLDPGRQPLEFFVDLLLRWPLLQLGQWLQVPIDAVVFLPPTQAYGFVALAIVACAGLLWLFVPLLKTSKLARFWALGMSFALVPLCAAFPMDRLLIYAGIGAFALLAMQVEALAFFIPARNLLKGRLRRIVVTVLLLLHLPVAAFALVGRSMTIPIFGNLFRSGADTAPRDAGIEKQALFFVSGHEFSIAYLPIIRAVEGGAVPKRVALLASLANDKRITRVDVYTLLIEPEGGFLAAMSDRLERHIDKPFSVAERIQMPDFVAEVRSVTDDGRPLSVAFCFKLPLEDVSYRWLSWGSNGVETFLPPSVGQSINVPAAPLTSILRVADGK